MEKESKNLLIQAFLLLRDFLIRTFKFLREIFTRIGKSIQKVKSKIKSRVSRVKGSIKKKLKYANVTAIRQFIVFVFSYGFLINYTLKVLLKFEMTIFSVPAWGILYYFIREELVVMIRKIRGRLE